MPTPPKPPQNGDHPPDERVDLSDPPLTPPRGPRGPLDVAADCAIAAKDAALQAAGWAGEALAAASASKLASEKALGELVTVRADITSIRADLAGIAKAIGVKRSYSGSGFAAVSQPSPPPPPLQIQTYRKTTDTGEHEIIEKSELERVMADFEGVKRQMVEAQQRAMVAEAEERGARDYAEKLEEAEKKKADTEAAKRARDKELRDKVLLVLAFVTPAGIIISWLAAHYH